MQQGRHYDVVIVGAGMAGLCLCRQLELESGGSKSILILDNRPDLPGKKQKVGESLVQVAGYYLTRMLDLEQHLLEEQFPKFNLRFHWKTSGSDNRDLEDYARSYIGKSSNVATYQVNRNTLECHLLDLVRGSGQVRLANPILNLDVRLSDAGPHTVAFDRNGVREEVTAGWVVDASGRAQLFKKRQNLKADVSIRHGSSWCWVEGLVDIERLTELPRKELRRRRDLNRAGLFPFWLATNHFCGEGFWFWIIPLKGMTSLGIVFDSSLVPFEEVSSAEKLIAWICREFPLFERDLPKRRIIDSARLAEYSYDCRRTISASRWAISGMAGRFSDPLYSPGSDLIAYYNTIIVDAILEKDPEQLRMKAELYEALMKVVFDAYVPSYSMSYDALGDQETFTMKYAWELAVYFTFYAYPFINDLFTNVRFVKFFFRKFAQLGPVNRSVQQCLTDYYQWKKLRPSQSSALAYDFLDLTPLKKAEMTYYQVSPNEDHAEETLEGHLRSMREFARYLFAYVSSVVLEDPRVLLNRGFVESIKLNSWRLDPEALRAAYAPHAGCAETCEWGLNPLAMEVFRPQSAPMHADAETGVPA